MNKSAMYMENQRLKKALAGVMPWVGMPAEGPTWATQEAKERNKAACQKAFDEACKCFPANYSGLSGLAEEN